MIPKKQFEGWMRHQLYVDIESGFCRKFVIKHVNSASRGGHTIMSVDVPTEEGQPDDSWISENITLIEETTAADASGNSGVQSYIIFSYHGEEKEKPTAKFSIRMAGEAEAGDDDLGSEPPTQKGLMAQTMRHMEAIMRTASLSQSTTMSAMQRTVVQQGSVIEKLLDEKFNNISVIENLLSQKNERDIETMKAQKSMEMKEKALDTLKMVAPTILNKMLTSGDPKNVATMQAISSRDNQLAVLADSLTAEQLEKMSTVLSAEQAMLIVDVLTQVKQQQQQLLAAENKK